MKNTGCPVALNGMILCGQIKYSFKEISAVDFAALYQIDSRHINLPDAGRKSELDSEHLVGTV
jgi:hypothetical protein